MQIDLTPVANLLVKEIPGLAGAYVFGSQATGAAREGSDVDLAVFAGRPIKREELLENAERVARLVRREVDLIDLADANPILQMQVLREGRLIAAPDPTSIGLFELRALRDYRDLKRRRAGIEADIMARGRVHAG